MKIRNAFKVRSVNPCNLDVYCFGLALCCLMVFIRHIYLLTRQTLHQHFQTFLIVFGSR